MGKHRIRRSVMEPTELELTDSPKTEEPEAKEKTKPKRTTTKPAPKASLYKVTAVGSFSFNDKKYDVGDTFYLTDEAVDELRNHVAVATVRDGHPYIVVG
jgi:hypothetical protein